MEEVVEVKRSLVIERVRLRCWVLFKLHDLGVGQSGWRIGPWGRTRWAIVGLFRPRVAYRGFVLVTGEDAHWHWFSTERRLHECVGRLIEAPWDVIEFEAIELVLQPLDFLAVCSHLGIMAA